MKRITLKTLVTTLLLSIIMSIPCFCFDGGILGLDLKDKSLLTVDLAWSSMSEQERLNYTLQYMPYINSALGLPADTFPASNVHAMLPNDPAYTKAVAYTDYGTKQIYLNMNRINQEAIGAWAPIYALAHETRHLYQEAFNTIPKNLNATIDNPLVYATDAREADANAFAEQVIQYVLASVGSTKVNR